MATLETLRPAGTIATGVWTPQGAATLHAATDETTPNGDTDYASLVRSTQGQTDSTFELSVTDPTEWEPNALQVRDAGAWDTPIELRVRDAEAWKTPKSIRVRDGEAWVSVIPEVVVSVTARREIVGNGSASGTVQLKVGTTVLASASLTIGDSYAETTLTASLDALLGIDPDDLRVAILGTVIADDGLSTAELRVTQLEVDLND